MTKEEKHLWYDFLRPYPVKFMKQKPIGNYIVDFFCKLQSWSLNWMVPNTLRRKGNRQMPNERHIWKALD